MCVHCAVWLSFPHSLFLYLCISLFVHFNICVFLYLCISIFVHFYICVFLYLWFFLVKLYKCAFTVLCGCNSHNARGRNILVLFPPSSPLTLQTFTRSLVWYFKTNTLKQLDIQGSPWPYWPLDPCAGRPNIRSTSMQLCSDQLSLIMVDLNTRLFSRLKEEWLQYVLTNPPMEFRVPFYLFR